VEVPHTRYAKNGDVHVAYHAAGGGPLDILFPTQIDAGHARDLENIAT
jgi:hypothetical protein